MQKQVISGSWRKFALAVLLPAAALLSFPVGAQITNGANAVNSNHIADNAVGSAQIANNGVRRGQIATNGVTSSDIAYNSVNSAKLANNSLNLFDGIYNGVPEVGDQVRYYAQDPSVNFNFIPGPQFVGNCSLVDVNLSGLLIVEYTCTNSVDPGHSVVVRGFTAPFDGVGAINADRVLEENAISGNELSIRAIGYQNYFHNAFNGGADLGDSHYADNGLDNGVFAEDSINTAHLSDSAIGAFLNDTVNADTLVDGTELNTAKLADNAVASAKLVGDAITTAKLVDDAVTTAKLADNAVSTAKIVDIAVNTAKLADNAVSAADLVDDAVTTAVLADNAVFSADFADDAITTAKLADNAVNSADFADNAVTTAKIVDDAVTAEKLAKNAVFSADFADDAITTAKLADNAVASAGFADNAVTTAKIVDASVTTAKLADNAVFSADFVDGAVTGAKLVDGVVTTAKLADGAVTAAKLIDDSLTSTQIGERGITGIDIVSEAITTEHFTEGAVVSDSILDASVGEVELDIRLISDFDAIARTGQHTVSGALAIVRTIADNGNLTSTSGAILAPLSFSDKSLIYELIENFTTSGMVASGQLTLRGLTSGLRLHIGGLLGGAALAQQEIGSRTDSVGSDWATSTIRGQTSWLRTRSMELGERVDVTHQHINRLDEVLGDLDRAITMAAAVGSAYVDTDSRGSIDLAVSSFGERRGLSADVGYRLTDIAQINFGIAATEDLDERILRFGALLQY